MIEGDIDRIASACQNIYENIYNRREECHAFRQASRPFPSMLDAAMAIEMRRRE